MLNLYIEGYDHVDTNSLIQDCEKAFSSMGVNLINNEETQKILKNIEEAEYCDRASFIDRFGYRVRSKYLSTGCKAALLALYYSEKIISLRECGRNARDAILTYVKNGNVMIHPESLNLDIGSDDDDEVVEVKYRDKIFNDLYKLNEYIFEECL